MNREIKFRAWDTANKVWLEPNEHNIRLNSSSVCANHSAGSIGGIELMQYTGLKDKNGTEIYEGDIVEAVYVKENGHQYFIRGEVMWGVFGYTLSADSGNDEDIVRGRGNLFDRAEMIRGGGGTWEPFFLKQDPFNHKHGTSYHTDDKVRFEIIGNIYENPELLD